MRSCGDGVLSINHAMGSLVDHIERAYGDSQKQQQQTCLLQPNESAFNLLLKASERRGNIVLIWCETDGLADLVVTNLLRTIAIGSQLATLVIDHVAPDVLSFSSSLMASMTKVPVQNLITGQITDKDWDSISVALGRMHDSPLHTVEGGGNSIFESVKKWRSEISGGEKQLVLMRGLGVFDAMRGRQERSFDSCTEKLLAVAKRLSVLTELSFQKSMSVFVVLGNLYMDTVVQEQLFNQNCPLMGIGVDSCFIELNNESIVRVAYQSAIGKVTSDYRFNWPCRRIEWGPDEDESAQDRDGDEYRNDDVYMRTTVC